MDNDGDLDLVGIGDEGVWVSLWDESSLNFAPSTLWVNDFGAGAPGNYSKDKHLRKLIDWDGDGLTDIVAFGETAIVWSKNCGNHSLRAPSDCSNGGSNTHAIISNGYGYADNWSKADHLRSFGDVDGNGYVDIIAIGSGGVYVLRNLGPGADGTVNTQLVTMDSATSGADYQTLEMDYGTAFTSLDAGVNNGNSFRLIADIDGDGRDDILNASGSRMLYALGQPGGYFSAPGEICNSSQPCFTPEQGWLPDNNLVFLEDINNDDKPDLVGFGDSAVYVALNQSSSGNVQFGDFKIWSGDFVYNTGWKISYPWAWGNGKSIDVYPRYLADVNQPRQPHWPPKST